MLESRVARQDTTAEESGMDPNQPTRELARGTVYGPLLAGPDGCTVIDVFATGEPGSATRAMNTYVKGTGGQP